MNEASNGINEGKAVDPEVVAEMDSITPFLDALVEQRMTKTQVAEALARTNLGKRLAAKEVMDLALTDADLKIPNRRSLEISMTDLISKNKEFSVLIVDLDHFKAVNDSLGHPVGDQALEHATNVLNANLRRDKGDTLGRWGGEEFIIILPEIVDVEILRSVAERFRSSFEKLPFTHKAEWKDELVQRKLSVSIGGAVFDKSKDKDMKGIVGRIDAELYKAKQTRNTVSISG